jgi:PAS domain S-box-containing protein
MLKTLQAYSLAFDSNPHPMWVADRETMQLLAANDAAVERYGYSRSELAGMSVRDLRPPEAVGQILEFWKRLATRTFSDPPISAGVLTHRRKDGSLLSVEVTASRVQWEGHDAYLAVTIDVTDRVRAQQQARENQERIDLVLNAVNDTIWDWNIRTGKVWRSQNSAELFRARRDEIEPTLEGWLVRVHPEDRERVLAGLQGALRRGDNHWTAEYRIPREDGSWAEVIDRAVIVRDAAGKPERVVGSMVDITDRKRADRALLEQQQRLKAVFDNAQDALFITTDEGRFLDANPAGCAMFGYTAAELGALDIWSLVLPELREEYRERVRHLLRDGHQEGEGLGRRKNGATIELEYRTVANIEPGIHLTVIRDISARKHAESSLRSLSGRILRVQDEERRRIARELHDSTAQSLAALTLELGVVRREAPSLKPRARRAIEEVFAIADNCTRELRTISYLLHPPLLDEMGLAAALKGYVDGFSQRSGVRVEIDMPVDLGRLPRESETALFRIVQESLTNVHRHSGSPVARIRLTLDERAVVLEVSDEGRGLEPRTPAANGAAASGRADTTELGVGIAGMKERVRQLGGHLELDSRGQGLTVRAYLPRGTS